MEPVTSTFEFCGNFNFV